MKTTIKIAWRNCWRNSLRSTIVIASIVLGIWSSIFLMGFSTGLVEQKVDKMVNLEIGDIQIHSKTYDIESDISSTINDLENTVSVLSNDPNVIGFSKRFKTDAFALSPHGQQGVKLLGVNPEHEALVLDLDEHILEGTFLDSKYTYPILIGKKLAKELHLRLSSKIQLNFTNTNAEQITKNFKVAGIFSVGNDAFDGFTVFAPQRTIERLTGEQLIHEIIVKSKDGASNKTIAQTLQTNSKNNLIESWQVRYPEIAYGVEMMDTTMYILMSIIIAALLFGIINTLVMSILERKKELGILMAIGMSNWNVRLMIVFESLIYGLIGGPVGILFGYITIQYFGSKGLDLSGFGQGMEAFGYDPIIYVTIDPKYYIIYTTYILLATFIGGFYPSRIATRLNPIEAIRSI